MFHRPSSKISYLVVPCSTVCLRDKFESSSQVKLHEVEGLRFIAEPCFGRLRANAPKRRKSVQLY